MQEPSPQQGQVVSGATGNLLLKVSLSLLKDHAVPLKSSSEVNKARGHVILLLVDIALHYLEVM